MSLQLLSKDLEERRVGPHLKFYPDRTIRRDTDTTGTLTDLPAKDTLPH